MSGIEDILYAALKLGIRKNVIERVSKLQKQNPYSHLNYLYNNYDPLSG